MSRQDIVGKSCDDLTLPELAASYEEKDEELLNNPGVQTYEDQVRYADGRSVRSFSTKPPSAGVTAVWAAWWGSSWT